MTEEARQRSLAARLGYSIIIITSSQIYALGIPRLKHAFARGNTSNNMNHANFMVFVSRMVNGLGARRYRFQFGRRHRSQRYICSARLTE